jgi:signal transduction histidine kinase
MRPSRSGPRPGQIAIHTGVIWADRELLQSGRSAALLGEGTYAGLCVRDSGRGLDEQARARIFDPLHSAKSSRGVGLAAALGAVRRQGGWICAKADADGEGTRYRVLLPSGDWGESPRSLRSADGIRLRARGAGTIISSIG